MKKREIICEYQPYIFHQPVASSQLRAAATSADGATIGHWAETWVKNIKANKERFGSFKKSVPILPTMFEKQQRD